MNLFLEMWLNIINSVICCAFICMTLDTNDFGHVFISPQSEIAQAMTLQGIFVS